MTEQLLAETAKQESAVKVSFLRTQQTRLGRFRTETVSIAITECTQQLGLQDYPQRLQHI